MKTTINIPEGFKLEKVSETEYRVVQDVQSLPETWEEFYEHSRRDEMWYISDTSDVRPYGGIFIDVHRDKNLLPNKKSAEAILALCQLIQLRDCYRQGWKPKYENNTYYPFVFLHHGDLIVATSSVPRLFSFQSEEITRKFLNNFGDLLKTVFYLWK